MSKSCGCKGISCPAPWILFGAGVGAIVGVITENVGLWVGIGGALGVVICVLRAKTSSCCSTKKDDSCCNNSEGK